MIKVLFVCHGNICRSPMAEFIMKKKVKELGIESNYIIDSAAVSMEEIGNPIDYRALRVLKNNGISHPFHLARIITEKDYEYYDYIFIMDESNKRRIEYLLGTDVYNKIKKIGEYLEPKKDISDPWYDGRFENVYNELDIAISNFIKELMEA